MEQFFCAAWRCGVDDEGQSAVEYALILVLLILAVLAIFANGVAGNTIELYRTSLQRIVDALN